MGHTRICPYCAERIEPSAIRCPFCRTDLAPAPTGSWPCVNCGAFNSGVSVCPSCGTARAGAPSRPFYAPPSRPMKAPSSDTAMTWGVVSIAGGFLCGVLFLLGPVAWHYGNKAEQECASMGIPVDSSAKAGKIMGMVATALSVLALLVFGAAIAIAFATGK